MTALRPVAKKMLIGYIPVTMKPEQPWPTSIQRQCFGKSNRLCNREENGGIDVATRT